MTLRLRERKNTTLVYQLIRWPQTHTSIEVGLFMSNSAIVFLEGKNALLGIHVFLNRQCVRNNCVTITGTGAPINGRGNLRTRRNSISRPGQPRAHLFLPEHPGEELCRHEGRRDHGEDIHHLLQTVLATGPTQGREGSVSGNVNEPFLRGSAIVVDDQTPETQIGPGRATAPFGLNSTRSCVRESCNKILHMEL